MDTDAKFFKDNLRLNNTDLYDRLQNLYKMKPEYLDLIRVRLENILADINVHVTDSKIINENGSYYSNRVLYLVLSNNVDLSNSVETDKSLFRNVLQVFKDSVKEEETDTIIDKLYDSLVDKIGSDLGRFQIYSTGSVILIVESAGNQTEYNDYHGDFLKRYRSNKEVPTDGAKDQDPCLTKELDDFHKPQHIESKDDIQYQLWIEQDGKIIHQGKVISDINNCEMTYRVKLPLDFFNRSMQLKFSDDLDIDTSKVHEYRIKIFKYTIKERNELGDTIRGSQEKLFEKDHIALTSVDNKEHTYEFVY